MYNCIIGLPTLATKRRMTTRGNDLYYSRARRNQKIRSPKTREGDSYSLKGNQEALEDVWAKIKTDIGEVVGQKISSITRSEVQTPLIQAKKAGSIDYHCLFNIVLCMDDFLHPNFVFCFPFIFIQELTSLFFNCMMIK